MQRIMVYVGAKITMRVTVKQNSQISGCGHSSLKLDPLGLEEDSHEGLSTLRCDSHNAVGPGDLIKVRERRHQSAIFGSISFSGFPSLEGAGKVL